MSGAHLPSARHVAAAAPGAQHQPRSPLQHSAVCFAAVVHDAAFCRRAALVRGARAWMIGTSQTSSEGRPLLS